MSTVVPTNLIDDVIVQNFVAKNKIISLISNLDSKNGIVRTASSGSQTETLISLFSKMMECLNMKYSGNDISEFIEKLSNNEKNDQLHKSSGQLPAPKGAGL